MIPKIKIGLKIWSNNQRPFSQIKNLFMKEIIDYLEIYLVPGTASSVLPELKRLAMPLVLHAPHSTHYFNPSDQSLLRSNLNIFAEIKKFASELNFPPIIIHPEQGDIQQSLLCLDQFDYPRILIENMPKKGINQEKMIGYAPQEIKLFLRKGYGFCLDISHALKAAHSLKKEPEKFIKEFLELKPRIFHLCGGHLNKEEDEHLNLWEGNFPLKFLKECIKNNENRMVTLETPKKDLSSLREDRQNIRYFKQI